MVQHNNVFFKIPYRFQPSCFFFAISDSGISYSLLNKFTYNKSLVSLGDAAMHIQINIDMFNAILCESAHEIPTDPIVDPRALQIPAGDLSIGSGAQLKNSVSTVNCIILLDVDEGISKMSIDFFICIICVLQLLYLDLFIF